MRVQGSGLSLTVLLALSQCSLEGIFSHSLDLIEGPKELVLSRKYGNGLRRDCIPLFPAKNQEVILHPEA